MTEIRVLDGARTIGGSKIHLRENDAGIFLDFGLNFKTQGEYFQNFLNARSSRGIHDYWRLNLIPHYNIYRQDLIPTDLENGISSTPSLPIDAVVLSHAHMDHFGHIPLLQKDIPVIASSISISLLKAILDSSNSSYSTEVAFFDEKIRMHGDGRVIKSDGKKRYLGRSLYTYEDYSPKLAEFITCPLKAKTKKIEGGGVDLHSALSLSFKIRGFPVDHSIYGASAYLIDSDTTIAYSGDFRFHGKYGNLTREFFKNAKSVSVLIIEGTRALRDQINDEDSDDTASSVSEEDVRMKCLKTVDEAKDLVIANFSPRNIERLECFKHIADKTDRILVIPAKTAYLLKALECAEAKDYTAGISIFQTLSSSTNKWEAFSLLPPEDPESEEQNAHRMDFGTQMNYIDPHSIKEDPEKYILCLSFYDVKHLLDIMPQNGTYIYSSSEAFTEEAEFDFIRFYHWLNLFNFSVYGFSVEEKGGRERPTFTKGYHSSGHASIEDLRWAIETADPDVIIPVHTENPEWFESEFDGVLLPVPGRKITL